MESSELLITAELAEIELKEGDLERLGEEVARMVEYFDTMKGFDVTGLEPTTHAFVRGNRVRPDNSNNNPNNQNTVTQDMLDQAPDLEGRLFVIPNIL
jgi:aspartyl-tRNA(Asn)/glutamyl-tRNA(Gln) amidotransferase subunit C